MNTKNKIQYSQTRKAGNLAEDFPVSYLHHQFPWLSESEINEAIELIGKNADDVIKYLDRKGSTAKTVDEDI